MATERSCKASKKIGSKDVSPNSFNAHNAEHLTSAWNVQVNL